MRHVDTVDITRKLAKTAKFQSIYNNAKEIGLKLFKNDSNYSDLQLLFLNFLNFYASLSLDIALGEIDEKVLTEEIYEDAYMHYRRKTRGEKNSDLHKPMKNLSKTQKQERKPASSTSTWVFKTPPKEVK